MIRPLLLSASTALVLALAPSGPARAQEAPAPATAAAPAFVGLTPEEVREFLIGVGARISEVNREDGGVYLRIDENGLVWFLFFYGCQPDGRCSDVQFNSVFSGQGVSAETISAWNRDTRFLKAFAAEVDGNPVIFVQFDHLLTSGQSVEQFADPILTWLQGLAAFGGHLRAAVAPTTPAPAT